MLGKIVLGCIIVFGLLVLGIWLYFSPYNTFRDVLLYVRDYRATHEIDFSRFGEIVPHTTTELEIYSLFGPHITRRLTYSVPRTKSIKDNTFTYSKIINYKDTDYDHSRKVTGNLINESSTITHRQEATIYLQNGVVQYFALKSEQPLGNHDFALISPSTGLDETDNVWPDSIQDIADYRNQ